MSEQLTNGGNETETTIVVQGAKSAGKLRKDGTPRKERVVVDDQMFLLAYKDALKNKLSVGKLAAQLNMATGSVIQRINSINEFLHKAGKKMLPKLTRASGPRKNTSALASLVESLEIGNGEGESLPVDAPISGEAPEMSDAEANSEV